MIYLWKKINNGQKISDYFQDFKGDDINIEDAVNNLVNDTRWQFVLENEHQDEINLFGSMSDSCSSSDQSSEPSWNVDADLADFNEKSQEESTLKMLLNTAELLKQHSLESNPERTGPNLRENRDRLRNKNTETHKHIDCPHSELLNNASACKPQHSTRSKEKFSRKSKANIWSKKCTMIIEIQYLLIFYRYT